MTAPTPYPYVNAVLDELLSGVREILGERFVGLYLDGSLAAGDFNPQRSDIDFLVATTSELPDEQVLALAALHARLAAGDSPWGSVLEGSYIPLDALRRYDPAHASHPNIEWGGELKVEKHERDWVIHRHILRQHGIALAGPAPQALIDPVSPAELHQAVQELFKVWWAPMLSDPAHLRHPGYQVYAVHTMCRILYTLEFGAVVSKPVAARWAQERLGKRHGALIADASAWINGQPFDHLDETLDLIRYTQKQIQP
jgi:hypothetical protein